MPPIPQPLKSYDPSRRVHPGERYNFLTVIAFSHTKHRHRYWTCLCDCGQETITREASLKAGTTGSCGCHAKARREAFEDLTGKVFGRLIVVGVSSEKAPVQVRSQDGKLVGSRRYWDCVCECGGTKTASGGSLKAGKTKSCGCLQRDTGVLLAEQYSTTHGLSHTRLYKLHQSMLVRCNNPDNPYYGGKGIAVAEDLKDFTDFNTWFVGKFGVTEPPPGLSLDRIDNRKGYTKDNIRLADCETQSKNKDRALIVETSEGPRYLIDVCEELGIEYESARLRYHKYGKTLEAMFPAPQPRQDQAGTVRGVYCESGEWRVHLHLGALNGPLGQRFPTQQAALQAREEVLVKLAAVSEETLQGMTPKEFRTFIRSAL